MTMNAEPLLAGKVAIVTGGGSGLGAATARALAAAGASVAVLGRRMAKLEQTVAQIEGDGGKAIALPCDMAVPAEVGQAIASVFDRLGRIDILINNAGRHASFEHSAEVDLADFDDFMFVNLRGPFVAIQSVLPHMLAAEAGAIVNIGSMAGLVGLKYAAPYCAVKGGLVMLTKALAVEYADKGITVNCLCPGAMEPTESRRMARPDHSQMVAEAMPLGLPNGRRANVFDVGQFVVALVSPSNSCMTGAIIPIDGGYSAG